MRAADQQILRGVPAAARAVFLDQDGEKDTAIDGAVTVEVTSAWSQQTFTTITATGGNGVYEADLPSVAEPDLLTCVWSDGTRTVTTVVEVVSRYYATLEQIRGLDGAMATDRMLDDSKFPRSRLLAARRFVEEEFEEFCHRAFVPRYAEWRGHVDGYLWLPHPDVRAIREFTVDGTATTPDVVLPSDGGLLVSGVSGDVVVKYEHGAERPHQMILKAFFARVRNVVNSLKSGVPDQATTYTATEGGTYSLLVEGRGGSLTAMPGVDIVLREHEYMAPVIG